MERQGNRVGDHGVYCAVGIAILGLLSYLASQSPVVIHKLDLPILSVQAKIFSVCFFSDDFEKEHHQILKIMSIMDKEAGKRSGYRTINTPALKDTVRKVSVKTAFTARYLTIIIFILAGSLMIISTVRTRDILYDKRENINTSGKTGVEGFIGITGGYLTGEAVSVIRASPTPENLDNAFRAVRERINIPCSVVGRLFPKGSAERLTLLGYGKTKVFFAQEKDPAQDTAKDN